MICWKRTNAGKVKGLERQREKKSTQVQKEIVKSSALRQKARQQRKKWLEVLGIELKQTLNYHIH